MGNLKKPKAPKAEVPVVEPVVKSKAPSKSEILFENPELIVDEAQNFYKNNKNLITIVTVGIVAVVLGGYFAFTYLRDSEQKAQVDMFQAEYYFGQDSLRKAIDGDGNNMGFLEIIDEYKFTKSANLAKFYAGVAYLRLGEYESAIEHLKSFSTSDPILEPRKYALIGDAYVELDDLDNAIANLKKATETKPDKHFTPGYLIKLGLAYEANGDLDKAILAYSDVLTKFPLTADASEAKRLKAKAELTAQNP